MTDLKFYCLVTAVYTDQFIGSMNAQRPLVVHVKSKEPKLNNAAFNQDQSCFAICTDTGFKVYSTYPMELKMERDFSKGSFGIKETRDSSSTTRNVNSGIGIVKMLYKTNYVALVGGGKKPRSPLNKLCIWDDLKEKNSIVLEFNTPLLNIHLSRTHIVALLKNNALVYSFKSKPELLFSFETDDNEPGASDLAICESSSILVFPGRNNGQIHIVDIINTQDKKSVSLIKAHRNPVQCLALSPRGNLVASASTKGTIIRIHDTKNCTLVYEFRRGVDPAIISDMKFAPSGTKLAVLSDKCTLHIYHLGEENKKHLLKDLPLFPNYFKSTWSVMSKNVGNKSDLVNDIGTLGWVNDNVLVIVWKYKGIWEKYDIISNEMDSVSSEESIKWEIVKEGWRSV